LVLAQYYLLLHWGNHEFYVEGTKGQVLRKECHDLGIGNVRELVYCNRNYDYD